MDKEDKKTSFIDQIKQLVGPEGLRTEVNITLTTETLFRLIIGMIISILVSYMIITLIKKLTDAK